MHRGIVPGSCGFSSYYSSQMLQVAGAAKERTPAHPVHRLSGQVSAGVPAVAKGSAARRLVSSHHRRSSAFELRWRDLAGWLVLTVCTLTCWPLHAQSVLATLPAGTNPYAVAVNPVTNQIYVANNGGGSVTVMNGTTASVVATIPVGTGPKAVAINPVTNQVYVANAGSGSVTVIDGSDQCRCGDRAGGKHPDGAGGESGNKPHLCRQQWRQQRNRDQRRDRFRSDHHNGGKRSEGATFSTSALSQGLHLIVAIYSADSSFASGTQQAGQSVTFTAYVTPDSGAGVPTGLTSAVTVVVVGRGSTRNM